MRVLAIVALTWGSPVLAYETYEASPYNYENSEFNYENSEFNYENSPYNYENSRLNRYSDRAVYDSSGRRIGYEVEAPSGVVNIFNNAGKRIGYKPARRK